MLYCDRSIFEIQNLYPSCSRYIRMSVERFDHLLSLLDSRISKRDTNFRKSISARERLVITLRFLSSGSSQQSLSFSFVHGRSTISKILQEVCDAIYEVLAPLYLKTPASAEDWKSIANDFENIWNLPHTVGAIDGKHIAMDCPKNSGTQDHNYKGFFSMNLLAICDARYNFTMFDIGQYGSNNDSGVLLNSEMGKRLEEGSIGLPEDEKLDGCRLDKLPYYLVGDEIFPLKSWLIRPYPGKLNEEQRIFNYRLSRARRIIENTFGILVARWRIFRGPIRASRDNVLKYTLAAICLHNYLRQTENAVYTPAGFIDSDDGSGTIKPGEWRRIIDADAGGCLRPIARVRGSRYSGTALDMREALKEYLNSEAGSVDWQLNYVRRTGKR